MNVFFEVVRYRVSLNKQTPRFLEGFLRGGIYAYIRDHSNYYSQFKSEEKYGEPKEQILKSLNGKKDKAPFVLARKELFPNFMKWVIDIKEKTSPFQPAPPPSVFPPELSSPFGSTVSLVLSSTTGSFSEQEIMNIDSMNRDRSFFIILFLVVLI